jgi:hypothetical protein
MKLFATAIILSTVLCSSALAKAPAAKPGPVAPRPPILCPADRGCSGPPIAGKLVGPTALPAPIANPR